MGLTDQFFMGTGKGHPFYKEDSNESELSSSEEGEREVGNDLYRLLLQQKGKCYWKQKLKKFSHKLFKELIKNNQKIDNISKDLRNINEVVDEMREEIEDEDNIENTYYEQLRGERIKLATDIKKLRKELSALKEH
eukprot:TRINITY_DN2968_c0_g1_i11.p1 TRINITY_DN2968_c0_g1~~TRINITY_DN2968_c0_g1_i11.p1  ORF type:complete len:136 (+),score=45.92 TRINITY_DN2968_c0_g1_i11:908-1315(+)